jgi:hypothetical protein
MIVGGYRRNRDADAVRHPDPHRRRARRGVGVGVPDGRDRREPLRRHGCPRREACELGKLAADELLARATQRVAFVVSGAKTDIERKDDAQLEKTRELNRGPA